MTPSGMESQVTTISRLRAAIEMIRLPLVITAISNAQAAFILRYAAGGDFWTVFGALALLAMSLGLFGFAAIFNDIVDVNRDRYLAPDRPLVSGRFDLQQAYLLAACLLAVGCIGGIAYAWHIGSFATVFFLLWCVILIIFYNTIGKYFGAVGILTLGLLFFCHAVAAQPELYVIWHGLLIMNHVVILTAICYVLENKRPKLSGLHQWAIGLVLLGLNLLLCAGVVLASIWRQRSLVDIPESLAISQALVYPMVALLIFIAFIFALILPLRTLAVDSGRKRLELHRITGRRLMRIGLIWLVIYDLAFIYGYLREF